MENLDIMRGRSMIRIYILNTKRLDGADFYELTNALPFGENEKKRLIAIENSKHKWESLGGLMALGELIKKCGITESAEISRASTGKPCFANSPSFPFGISHSNGICAAALGDTECVNIGFDMEIIDENVNCEAIAKRFFDEAELKEFYAAQCSVESFYSIWTAKEAFAKLDGRGLASVLSSKQGTHAENAYLSRLSVDIDGRRAVLSVYCHAPEQPIQIFCDSEEK